MAVGAYTVGILTVDHQVPFWIAFALSGVRHRGARASSSACVSLRLKGHYFSIFTLCVGYIMFLRHREVGKPDARHRSASSASRRRRASAAGRSTRRARCTTWCSSSSCVGVWVDARASCNSLLGRTFVAIRNSDELAESLGIDLMRNKLLAFVLSVFYAGLAGGLYAGFVRFLGPGPGRASSTPST